MHTIYIINNDMFVKGEVLTGKEVLLFSNMTNTQTEQEMEQCIEWASFTERLCFINVALFH